MNAILARNVRTVREHKNWTQQHLADAAGVKIRTVQRVENSEGASAETLTALAAAFNLPIDFLRTDLEALSSAVQKQFEELTKTHNIVEMTTVRTSADLNIIVGADANYMDCAVEDDAVQDAFAELKSYLVDVGDVWDSVDAINHRGWIREAYTFVEKLNALGCVVCVGKGEATHRGVKFQTLYVMGWTPEQVMPRIATPKKLL